MTPTQLRRIGEVVFGRNSWQTDLASVLGVSDRTVRNWVSGKSPVPVNLADALSRFARQRARRLAQIADDLNG